MRARLIVALLVLALLIAAIGSLGDPCEGKAGPDRLRCERLWSP